MYRIIAVFAAILITLTGCASSEDSLSAGMHFREKLLKGNGCRFKTEIRADFGDTEYTFSVSCETEKDGVLRFSVLAPEVISGITGYIDQQSGKLTFDDTILSFPLLAEGELPPVCGPWFFYKALTGGYIKALGEEDGYTRLTIDDNFHSENISVEIWLLNDTPVYSEILWQGRNVLSIKVSDFEIM